MEWPRSTLIQIEIEHVLGFCFYFFSLSNTQRYPMPAQSCPVIVNKPNCISMRFLVSSLWSRVARFDCHTVMRVGWVCVYVGFHHCSNFGRVGCSQSTIVSVANYCGYVGHVWFTADIFCLTHDFDKYWKMMHNKRTMGNCKGFP